LAAAERACQYWTAWAFLSSMSLAFLTLFEVAAIVIAKSASMQSNATKRVEPFSFSRLFEVVVLAIGSLQSRIFVSLWAVR